MRFGSIFLLGISFLDDASQLCHAVHSWLPDPGQNGGEMGSWLLGEQSLKSSGPRVFRKVCSHTWLSPPSFDRDPSQAGLWEGGEGGCEAPSLQGQPPTQPQAKLLLPEPMNYYREISFPVCASSQGLPLPSLSLPPLPLSSALDPQAA